LEFRRIVTNNGTKYCARALGQQQEEKANGEAGGEAGAPDDDENASPFVDKAVPCMRMTARAYSQVQAYE
jgi:hypothetical protein